MESRSSEDDITWSCALHVDKAFEDVEIAVDDRFVPIGLMVAVEANQHTRVPSRKVECRLSGQTLKIPQRTGPEQRGPDSSSDAGEPPGPKEGKKKLVGPAGRSSNFSLNSELTIGHLVRQGSDVVDSRVWLWRGRDGSDFLASVEAAARGEWLALTVQDGIPVPGSNQNSFANDIGGSIWFASEHTMFLSNRQTI